MPDALEYAQIKAQRIKDLIPERNTSGIKILDFGCGSGLMTNYLQEVFFEATVIGVDQSATSIAQAQQGFPEIEFQSITKKHINFSNNYFDVVVAADVFHHIVRADHEVWVQELLRVLKPNGYFILLELNPWNFSTRREFKKNPLEKNAHMLSPFYVKKLVKPFGAIKTNYYNFFPEALSFFVFLEPYLAKIPLGRAYIVLLQKN